MKFDVAVIGAGPAGISAALSSARNGSRTVLCTDRPVLGGNSSSEIRVWTRGATGGGNLFSEEMGTFGRLKLRNLAENPDGNVLYWDEILLDSALNEKNLTLYLNLPITEIKTDNSHVITSVSGTQLSSGKRIEIEADRYIDATGDGEIAYLAGCPFMSGTESRYVFGESMAGESDTKDKLCSSLLWQTKLLDHPVPYTPPSYAYSLSEVENMRSGTWHVRTISWTLSPKTGGFLNIRRHSGAICPISPQTRIHVPLFSRKVLKSALLQGLSAISKTE